MTDLDRAITRRHALKGSLALATGTALAPVIAACGGDASSAADDSFSLARNQKVAIDYWIGLSPAYEQALEKLLAEFGRANPNITVRLKNSSSYPDLNTALQAALAAKEPPALASIGYSSLPYAAEFFPHMPASELAKAADGSKRSGWMQQIFSPQVLELGQTDGTQHILPYTTSSPCLIYNADTFGEAGLRDAPRTWPELRQHARTLTAHTGRPSFSTGEKGYVWVWQSIIESNGPRLLVDDGDGYSTQIDMPAAIEAMQFMADMAHDDKSLVNLEDEQLLANFQNGSLPMITSAGSFAVGAKFNVGIALLPTWPGKDLRVPIAGNGFMFFDVEDAKKAAAWKLAHHLCSRGSVTELTENVGVPPSRKDVADDPRFLRTYYAENPEYRAFNDALEYAVPWVSFPGESGPKAVQVLSDARDRVFAGEDVAGTMRSAAEQINDLLNTA